MRHDIRTPISGIVGCADIIVQEKNNPTKVEEYAGILIKSGRALLNFLSGILDSVRIVSGEIPVVKKKFNLKLVLEEVLNLNQPKACEKQLCLTLEYDDSIPSYVI